GEPAFASVASGLTTFRAHDLLAGLLLRLGQHGEAEQHWRQALAACPGFLPSWAGLAGLLTDQRRWEEVEGVARRLESALGAGVGARVVRARAPVARREHAAARPLLEEAARLGARALWPRVVLSHCLLQAGHAEAAEQALLDVLALDPANA